MRLSVVHSGKDGMLSRMEEISFKVCKAHSGKLEISIGSDVIAARLPKCARVGEGTCSS